MAAADDVKFFTADNFHSASALTVSSKSTRTPIPVALTITESFPGWCAWFRLYSSLRIVAPLGFSLVDNINSRSRSAHTAHNTREHPNILIMAHDDILST